MAWPLLNLGDDLEELQKYLVRKEPRPSATVKAPCCGRLTSADAVLDIRMLELEQQWLCDACRHRFVTSSENAYDYAGLLEALGAPASVIANHRAILERRARRKAVGWWRD